MAWTSLYRTHVYFHVCFQQGFMCASSMNLGVNRWSGDYLRVVDVKHQLKNSFWPLRDRFPRIPVGWVLFREGGERSACRGVLGAFKLSRVH